MKAYVIDTSGWIEYFTNGENADFFAHPILDKSKKIVVPVIVLYEMFKKILSETGEDKALQVVAQLQQYHIEAIDDTLALSAAKISHTHKIPMADSLIYAVARKHDATLWTSDEHFRDMPHVRYIRKK